MANTTPAGPYCSEIFIDFNNVIEKADALEELSESMSKTGEQILQEWTSSNVWSGPAANDYKIRVIFLSKKINAEASRLKTLAGAIRLAAEALKKVEKLATEIISTKNHGGGGSGR